MKNLSNVWVLHVQSEANENYYAVFSYKPSEDDILDFQREKYISEYGEDPEDEYFTDLMGQRALEEVVIK